MKTPISYYGGKQMLLKHILPLIPEHSLYTEAFCGGCAVLFAKKPVRCEVINDTNTELVNFYRVAQMKYPVLKELIDATLHSREIHAHARHINAHPTFFTPVERAWAVWVCTKLGFASMIDGTFGYDRTGTTTQKLRNAREVVPEAGTCCCRVRRRCSSHPALRHARSLPFRRSALCGQRLRPLQRNVRRGGFHAAVGDACFRARQVHADDVPACRDRTLRLTVRLEDPPHRTHDHGLEGLSPSAGRVDRNELLIRKCVVFA